MKALRFHRSAREEIRAAVEHYAAISPELGGQFLEAMEALIGEIRLQPALYRVFDSPARRHFGRRFPFAIVYVDLPECIWIVAVAHFKQRPGYWAQRLS